MPRVSDEYRAARREQVLGAAMRCVAREGFHRTTMADVIAESGLSAGAVYGYFSGKNEIILAIVTRSVGHVAEALGEITSGPRPVSPVAALRTVLARVEELAEGPDGDITKVIVQAWAEAARDDEVRELVRREVDEIRQAWVALLERAQADGTLPADADPEVTARTLVALLPGYILQRVVFGDVSPESFTAAAEALGLR